MWCLCVKATVGTKWQVFEFPQTSGKEEARKDQRKQDAGKKKPTDVSCPNKCLALYTETKVSLDGKVGGCDDADDVERKKEGRKGVGKSIWRKRERVEGGGIYPCWALGRYLR